MSGLEGWEVHANDDATDAGAVAPGGRFVHVHTDAVSVGRGVGEAVVVPSLVLRTVLEEAGWLVESPGDPESLLVSRGALEIAEADRDTARAEVARLRALCAEAAPILHQHAKYWDDDDAHALTDRLASAGKGEP